MYINESTSNKIKPIIRMPSILWYMFSCYSNKCISRYHWKQYPPKMNDTLGLSHWNYSRRWDLDRVQHSHRLYSSSPHSEMVILLEVRPDDEPKDSTFLTTSIPSFTLPKTTCLPSSLNEHRGDLLSPPPVSETIRGAAVGVRLMPACWVMPLVWTILLF